MLSTNMGNSLTVKKTRINRMICLILSPSMHHHLAHHHHHHLHRHQIKITIQVRIYFIIKISSHKTHTYFRIRVHLDSGTSNNSGAAASNSGNNMPDGKVKSVNSNDEFERIISPVDLAIVLFGISQGLIYLCYSVNIFGHSFLIPIK